VAKNSHQCGFTAAASIALAAAFAVGTAWGRPPPPGGANLPEAVEVAQSLDQIEGQHPELVERDLEHISRGDGQMSDAVLAGMLAADPALPPRSLLMRVAALRYLRLHPRPALAPDLFRLFARARLGELPEDADLFEGALRAIAELPPADQARGLEEGLAPELARLAWGELDRRWLEPALEGVEGGERARALPVRQPVAWAQIEEDARSDLRAAWTLHGTDLIAAFSTEGGSVLSEAALQVEDRALAALILLAKPAVQEVLVAVVIDRGRSPPVIHDALASVGANDPVPEQPLRRLAPPALPPGQTPGLEAESPSDEAIAAVVRSGDGPHGSPLGDASPWLGGGLLLLLAGAVAGARYPRARRPAGLALGLGALCLAEGGGRAAGWAKLADTKPLFSFIASGAAVLETPPSGHLGWKQTAGGSMRADLFPEEPTAFRVVALGASSTQGSHYLREEVFPALVEARANQELGQRQVEVLNFGIGGANSASVRTAGEAALDVGADMLLVYYGHNEVAQFARLGRYQNTEPWRIAARMGLQRSVLYSALRSALPDRPKQGVTPTYSSSQAPNRASVQRLSDLAAAHYRWNLEALLRAAASRDVPVVLATVATNYRFAWLQPFRSAGVGDQADLDRHTAKAEAFSTAGRHAEARRVWQMAIDRSAWPREATAAINATTRALADEYDCALVDGESLLYLGSPDGVTASGRFWDDLHPTREGHDLLARAFTPLVVDAASSAAAR
jgi:lysophospholipase L1-like esterase